MTQLEKISAMRNLKKKGVIKPEALPDELNPAYMFNLTATELLCKIANGEIDAKEYATLALRNRGMDNNGNWIGFNL